MTLNISREQARRFLALYHFAPTDLMGTIERLATVQYDPLNPVGRNPDLVFQARVPGYQVDDWQKVAYTDRLIYDAWDKQASLCKSRSTREIKSYESHFSPPLVERETETMEIPEQNIEAGINKETHRAYWSILFDERRKLDRWLQVKQEEVTLKLSTLIRQSGWLTKELAAHPT